MPSLHAADALIIGVALAFVCRNWLGEVSGRSGRRGSWFSVMATANHFWLDCVAGFAVALVALAVVYARPIARRVANAL